MSGARSFHRSDRPLVMPRIFTPDAEAVVRFMRDVLGADGEIVGDRPADMRLGDSVVMVSTGGGVRAPMPACLYVYVPDVDAATQKAVASGSRLEAPPENQLFGDRTAIVRDPWGNVWQLATAIAEQEVAP